MFGLDLRTACSFFSGLEERHGETACTTGGWISTARQSRCPRVPTLARLGGTALVPSGVYHCRLAFIWLSVLAHCTHNALPFILDDLSTMPEGLRDKRLLCRQVLELMMRRRGKPGRVQDIMEQVFTAQ